MSVKTSNTTLDANSEAITMVVPFGCHGVATMSITGTITVTVTNAVEGSQNFIATKKSDGSTAAAYTASDTFFCVAPGQYTFTASGVSGGSCVLDTAVGRIAA